MGLFLSRAFKLNPRRAGARRHLPRAGGVFKHPPSISVSLARRLKPKTPLEISEKIVSKLFQTKDRSGQN